MPALIGGAISAVGAVASAIGGASRPTPKFEMGAEQDFEKQGRLNAEQGLAGYRSAMANEVAQGSGAQLDLANMLKRYSETGAVPSMEDIARSQTYAQSQFAPQETAMRQAFESQLTQANRAAAVSGRGVNDPLLRAKLAQEQTRQQATLQAQQGAFASQFAQQQPFQRLGFASDRANTLVQRGQTALGNFGTMAQLGLGAQQQGYGQRYDMASTRYMEQANTRSEGERMGSMLGGIGAAATSFSGVLDQQAQRMMAGMGGGGGGLQSLAGGGGGGLASMTGGGMPQAQQMAFQQQPQQSAFTSIPTPLRAFGGQQAPYQMGGFSGFGYGGK